MSFFQSPFLQDFLRWFCRFQFESLFPGASSTRRTTALCNLTLIKQIFSSEESSGMILSSMVILPVHYPLITRS